MHKLTILIFAALVTGCVAKGGISIWTIPTTYLAEYPLGEPQQAVFDKLGTPDEQATVAGRETWTYKYGEGYGARRYSFVFEDGKVYDVVYNDQGPYNGITARGQQGQKDTAAPE